MKVINFNREFYNPLISDTKTATIRSELKCEQGDTFQVQVGENIIGEASCLCTHPVVIDWDSLYVGAGRAKLDTSVIVKRLGFANRDEFFSFYDENYGLPFMGFIHFFKITSLYDEVSNERKA